VKATSPIGARRRFASRGGGATARSPRFHRRESALRRAGVEAARAACYVCATRASRSAVAHRQERIGDRSKPGARTTRERRRDA